MTRREEITMLREAVKGLVACMWLAPEEEKWAAIGVAIEALANTGATK